MATNYAQKLEREKQSPKGNVIGKIAIGSTRTPTAITKKPKARMNTDTGWMQKVVRGVKIAGLKEEAAKAKAKEEYFKSPAGMIENMVITLREKGLPFRNKVEELKNKLKK